MTPALTFAQRVIEGRDQIIGKFNGDVYILNSEEWGLVPGSRKFASIGSSRDRSQVLASLSTLNLVMLANEHEVQFRTYPEGQLTGRVPSGGDKVNTLHVSPSENFMALGDRDSSMSLWDLRVAGIPALLSMPLAKANPSHLVTLGILKNIPNLFEEVHHSIDYLELMLRHRFRFDIEISDIQAIKPGEFDIELG